ncbi:hypothetical protein V1318_17145 [Lysobacter sp. CCNWLW3]
MVIFMQTKALALAISCLTIASCASGDVRECTGKSMDIAPEKIGSGDVIDDVKWLMGAERVKSQAIKRLGSPKDLPSGESAWSYGIRREGRDCNEDGTYTSTFHVRYAIISMDFDARSCNVKESTYISSSAEVDPFGPEAAISEETMSCERFVAREQGR